MPLTITETDLASAAAALEEVGTFRCRKRGGSLIVESGPPKDPVPHLRLRKLSAKHWAVDAANHAGRWEDTPVRAPLAEALQTVKRDFPWLLAQFET